ncbi:hypothetical protein VTL71DRAFT_2963 [Oculimacula yallundae]|uniref:chitinase n=1 Tax=Oculimacula yallundae TaxID=86028 RepID=A0ABR4C5U9_9HELO
MFSTKVIAAAAASFSLMSSATADYNPASQANVAMYYGSGDNQLPLAHFCDSTSVDIIPIGFVNIFPNLANGLVAQNFGNQCWNDGNYTGPGYNGAVNSKNDFLYKRCPQLQEDIYYCQTKTKKKILLSLGGDGGDYKLNGEADGKYLAEFLWGAYGPYDDAWVAKGGVRPLDRGLYNTNASMTIDIDGFDFDIERASSDRQVGYIACIKRLRELFAAHKLKNKCSKTYLISGAPQCPLPEGNMGLTIAGAQFDILFIQFYNNAANGCTARNWISKGNAGGFNYNAWITTIQQGASKGAKVYLGLLGSTTAGNAGDYLTALESKSLIDAWHGAPQFGGVMLWEATYAENNFPSSFPGKNYYQIIKQLLNAYAPATTAPAAVCSTTVSSSSRSSTSTFKTSSSTKISTTSSTVQASTTSKPASSTASPTSSKVTSSSSSKLSSSTVKSSSSSSLVSSSSSVKPTSSSSLVSSSSSVKPSTSSSAISSSSTGKLSSTSAVLSSSSSVITSSSILTTKTSAGVVTSSKTSSSAAPVATECVYKGCYTEATNMRALSEKTLYQEYTMTIELCAEFCSGYAFYGLEYATECYCGNQLNAGSVLALDADAECNFACSGNGDEGCGGSNRLDVYECPAAPTTSSSSSSFVATSSVVSTSSSISVSETSSSASSTSSVVSTSSIVSISISESSSIASATSSSPTSSFVSTSSIVSITISESPSSSSTESATSSSAVSTSSIVSISISESSSTVSETSTSQSSSSVVPSSTSSAETFMTPTFSQTFSYGSTITSSSSVVTPTLSSSSGIETSKSSSSVGLTSSTQSGPVTSSSHASSSSSFTHYSNTSTSVGTTASASSTGVTSLPTSSKSSGGAVTYPPKPTTSSTTKYTTSTVCTTRVETITACPPSVTNCPVGSVTTKTIPLYTTVCPVTETKTPIGKPTTTPVPTYKPTGSVTKYTTSTVYTTSIYTITSCAPSVTDCPSKLGHVTTEIIKLYTTVCPVTETAKPTPSTYSPVSPVVEQPAFTGKAIPPTYDSDSTTTLSSTTTQYKTIKIVKSTATIVPVPYTTLAPYPTGPAGPGAGYPVGSGTAAPSAVAVTSSAEGADKTKTPVPVYATGSASSSRSAVGVMVAVVAGVVAFIL